MFSVRDVEVEDYAHNMVIHEMWPVIPLEDLKEPVITSLRMESLVQPGGMEEIEAVGFIQGVAPIRDDLCAVYISALSMAFGDKYEGVMRWSNRSGEHVIFTFPTRRYEKPLGSEIDGWSLMPRITCQCRSEHSKLYVVVSNTMIDGFDDAMAKWYDHKLYRRPAELDWRTSQKEKRRGKK